MYKINIAALVLIAGLLGILRASSPVKTKIPTLTFQSSAKAKLINFTLENIQGLSLYDQRRNKPVSIYDQQGVNPVVTYDSTTINNFDIYVWPKQHTYMMGLIKIKSLEIDLVDLVSHKSIATEITIINDPAQYACFNKLLELSTKDGSYKSHDSNYRKLVLYDLSKQIIALWAKRHQVAFTENNKPVTIDQMPIQQSNWWQTNRTKLFGGLCIAVIGGFGAYLYMRGIVYTSMTTSAHKHSKIAPSSATF